MNEVELFAGRPAGLPRHLNRAFALFQQRAGFSQENASRFRQMRAAPVAFEQPGSDFLLELADLAAQRGLGDTQFQSGFGETQFPRDGNEVAHLAEFHGETIAKRHQRASKEVLARTGRV